MSYTSWVHNDAKREIQQLPGHIRQRIRAMTTALAEEPRPGNSRALQLPEASAEWTVEVRRLRVEHWRVIYLVDDEWAEVGVLAVRQRPPYDYNDLLELLRGLRDDE